MIDEESVYWGTCFGNQGGEERAAVIAVRMTSNFPPILFLEEAEVVFWGPADVPGERGESIEKTGDRRIVSGPRSQWRSASGRPPFVSSSPLIICWDRGHDAFVCRLGYRIEEKAGKVA